MSCVFCNRSDAHVCSSCVQKILFMSMDKIREAAVIAEQKGLTEKAKVLNEYLEHLTEEEVYAEETRKARTDMVRARTLRTARLARG